MNHSWILKAKKWERYANYIYKEETCVCGCVKRIVIDEDGYEVVESYTHNGNTTFERPDCVRTKEKKKKGRYGSAYQVRKRMKKEAEKNSKE